MTAAVLIAQMPPRTYASRAGFRQAVRRWIIRKTGCEPIDAATDEAGNCLICGEAGRCCGLHTFDELAAAIGREQEGHQ